MDDGSPGLILVLNCTDDEEEEASRSHDVIFACLPAIVGMTQSPQSVSLDRERASRMLVRCDRYGSTTIKYTTYEATNVTSDRRRCPIEPSSPLLASLSSTPQTAGKRQWQSSLHYYRWLAGWLIQSANKTRDRAFAYINHLVTGQTAPRQFDWELLVVYWIKVLLFFERDN